MGAARFIGRVGGLAVALGVGAAWFAGGVASADSSSDSATQGRTATPRSGDAVGASPRTASGPASTRQNRGVPAVAPATDGGTEPRRSRLAGAVGKPTTPLQDDVRGAVVSVDVPAPSSTAAAESVPLGKTNAPSPAPAAPVLAAVPLLAAAPVLAAAPAGPGSALPVAGDPVTSVDPPLDLALLAAARREPLASAQAALASSSISVNPSVTWGGMYRQRNYDGILVGTLGASSSLELTYSVISDPSLGGKIASINSKAPSYAAFSPEGEFFYLPDATALTTPGQVETFRIMVAEKTGFDVFLASIPIVGLIAPTIIDLLHRTPILNELLAPLIGASEIVTFTVDPYSLAADRPTAFTTKVPSFDGLMISTNYFPATNVAQGLAESAPTVLNGPGLGAPGNTDAANPYGQLNVLPGLLDPVPTPDQFGSLTPGLRVLRDGYWISQDGGPSYIGPTGYNVITWDPRGEFASRDRSLPGLQIDSPLYEARDVSALMTWAASAANPALSQVAMETAGDPLIGMVGGSYGGGIQWTTAGTDPRVDAIIPQISWNSLISSLYPNTNQFKTGFGTVLLLALLTTGAHINTQIYEGVGTGFALGWLSQTSQAVLSSAGPTVLLNNITAPTLIFQGMQDVLFELDESVANAQILLANPNAVPTKMVWFCGGHGTCTDPLNPWQDDQGLIDNLKWLDQYVAGVGTPADEIPTFAWYDQLGAYYSSALMPFQDGFNLPDPHITTGTGGLLGLGPIIGGSGPGSVPNVSPVLTIGNATPAWNALNVTVTPPPDSQVVGAPTLQFTYSGLGTSRTVYAQLIDDTTGQVLGNLVTPVPVVLDGRERTVTIPLANIGYSTPPEGTLTLQITSSATNYENFTTAGVINVGDIQLDLPIRAGI